jgi:hypothetical protein
MDFQKSPGSVITQSPGKEKPKFRYGNAFFMGCDTVARSTWLSALIFICIVACAIVDGIATYPMFKCKEWLHYFNIGVTIIFVFECTVKILAQGDKPYRYFIGLESLRAEEIKAWTKVFDIKVICNAFHDSLPRDPDRFVKQLDEEEKAIEADYTWNIFDAAIAVLCVYGCTMFCQAGYGTIRVFRLLRIMKLLRYWKQLQDILRGLIGGLQASSSILLLFGFVFFLFGSIGVIQFGRNDPFHFGNLQRAMWTMYKLSNMEWLDVSDVALYGCDGSPGSPYSVFINEDHKSFDDCLLDLKGTHNFYHSSVVIMDWAQKTTVTQRKSGVVTNVSELVYRIEWERDTDAWLTVAEGSTPYDTLQAQPNGWTKSVINYGEEGWEDMAPQEYWCAPQHHLGLSERGSVIGPPYFILYIVVAGLILVTLFTGAVSVSMTLAVIEIRKEELVLKAKKQRAAEEALLRSMEKKFSRSLSSKSLTGDDIVRDPKAAYLLTDYVDRIQTGLVSADRKKYISGQRLTLWCLNPEAALPGESGAPPEPRMAGAVGTPAPNAALYDVDVQMEDMHASPLAAVRNSKRQMEGMEGNGASPSPRSSTDSIPLVPIGNESRNQALMAKRSGVSGVNLDGNSITKVRKQLNRRLHLPMSVCTLLCSSEYPCGIKMEMLWAEMSLNCYLVTHISQH